jgi:shikimate kinase
MERTLWLIGMMGSGKTTVAPLVADHLQTEWVDTDDLVEHLSGRRITDLVAESESVFREHEAEVVAETAGRQLVVACGGGVVVRPDNVERMRASGLVVWLQAAVDTLVARVGDADGRPLVGGDSSDSLERILDERAGLYGAAAHAVVGTDDRDPAEVAMEVVRAWNASSGE